jgi:hypothetical protein
MESTDLELLQKLLSDAQSSDNETRKIAEGQLLNLKNENPENYWIYMLQVLANQQSEQNVRVLSAILLRSAILSTQDKKKNLWINLTKEQRESMEQQVMELIPIETNKIVMVHIANLFCEVIATLYELEDQVHKTQPHELCKKLIESGEQMHVLAAMNIYIGLFDKIAEYMLDFKDDLMKVFEFTLTHQDPEIVFKGLQAICKLVYMLERKHSQIFVPLVDYIIKATMDCFERGDEDALERCLVELKTVCNTEPKFFLTKFSDICDQFSKISSYKDYDKKTIRIMPIEFITTIIVRLKTVFTKRTKTIHKVLEIIYGVMIDTDEEVDDEWLNPDNGTKIEEDEYSVDPTHVGCKCVDNMIREIGQEIMMPLVNQVLSSKTT